MDVGRPGWAGPRIALIDDRRDKGKEAGGVLFGRHGAHPVKGALFLVDEALDTVLDLLVHVVFLCPIVVVLLKGRGGKRRAVVFWGVVISTHGPMTFRSILCNDR